MVCHKYTLRNICLMLTCGALDDRPQLLKSKSMESQTLHHLETEPADPRISRQDLGKHSDSISRPVFPAGTSESSTPRVAMTPVSMEMATSLAMPTEAKPLAKMFQQFSHSILSTTFQTNKSDSAKRTHHKQRKEDQRWRNRYDTFAPLAEVRQRDIDSTEKKSTRSEKKLQSIKKDHRANTGQLATSLASAGAVIPPGSNDDDKNKRDIQSLRAELDRAVTSHDKARSDITKMRAELEKTKGELEKTTASLNKTKSNLGQTEFVASKQSRIEKELVEYREDLRDHHEKTEARLHSMSGRVEKVEANTVTMSTIRAMETNAASLTVNTDRAEKMVKQYEKLPDRILELEKRMQDQQSNHVMQADIGTHETKIQSLQSDHLNLAAKLSEIKTNQDQDAAEFDDLRAVVTGDGKSEKGLLDTMIASTKEYDDKFRNAVEAFNESMEDFKGDLKQVKTKVASIEDVKACHGIRINTLEDERPSHSYTSEDLIVIKAELSALAKTVESFEKDQNIKDDIVSTETERLDSELIIQTNAIKILAEKIDSLPTRSSAISPPPSVPSNGNISSPHLTNGTLAKRQMGHQFVEELENKHRVIEQELDNFKSSFQRFKESTMDVTHNHDTFITSLQQRFDNLTTDYMVKCMIHQMQSLYPQHPGNILNQIAGLQKHFGQLIGNQQHFDQALGQVTNQVSALDMLVKTNQHHIVTLIQTRCDQVGSTLTERIEIESRERLRMSDMISNEVNQRLERLITQEQGLRLKLQETIDTNVDQRLKVLTEEQQDSTSIIKQEITDHLGRIQALQKGLQSLRTDHTTSINNSHKAIEDLQTLVDQQSTSTADLRPAIDKVKIDCKEIWDTVLHDMPCHYSAICDLNQAVDLSNDKLNGTERDPNGSPSPSPSHRINRLHAAVSLLNSTLGLDDNQLNGVKHDPLTTPFTSPKIERLYVAVSNLNNALGFTDIHLNGMPNGDHTPAPHTASRARPRSPSMSLGQPSSPLRPPTSEGTGTREAPVTLSQSTEAGDDESDVPISSRSKRRRKPTRKSEESPMRRRKVGRSS